MPTNDELSDFLAGKIPLKDAEEIDRQVRDSATLQAQLADLSVDPLVERLRRVWKNQNLLDDGQQDDEVESTGVGSELVDRYCLIEMIGHRWDGPGMESQA